MKRLGTWLGFERADVLPSLAAVVAASAPIWGPVIFRG